MMAMKKRIFFSLLVLLVATATLVAMSITNPNDLTRPIAISGAAAMADGGSMEIQINGANGKKLALFRQGNLTIERSNQSLYLVNYVFGVVPFRRSVERRSPLANEARALLDSWLRDRLTDEQKKRLVANDAAALRETPGEVVMVFDMAQWIGE